MTKIVEPKKAEWLMRHDFCPGLGVAIHYVCSECKTEQMYVYETCPSCKERMEKGVYRSID
jgi:lipopolysaccharide biosynthesis regulator YciM